MPTGLQYAAPLPYRADRAEVKQWCTDTFGPADKIINSRWYMFDYTVQFSNENDRNWFQLRWA